MKKINAIFLAVACLSLGSCVSFDPLQRAADEADREGSRAARRHDGSNTLDSAFQVAETLYYSKKYPGSPEQIQKAITRGRLAVSQWHEHAEAAEAKMKNPGAPVPAGGKPARPNFIVVSIGKSESTGQTQAAIFDTSSKQIVGNNIYELRDPPKKDVPVKFDTFSAQYVGNGS